VTAQQTISDARARAAGLVSEAEEEAEKLRTDAKREADELVEQQRTTVVRDVKELEDVRASVQGDVDLLKRHLDEQRSRIRRGVEALALVLDDPEGLHVDESPELSDASMADVLPEPSEDADETIDVSDARDTGAEPESKDSVVMLNDGIDVGGVDLTAAPQPSRSSGGVFGAPAAPELPAEPAPSTSQLSPEKEKDGTPDEFPAVPIAASRNSGGPDIDLASEEIFAATEREDRAGPPTQQFTPFGETEDPLGPADDEADRAMRAFFETDFDAAEPEQKSRFGFRR
jgi:vacuolar-type H+-ATPase subunit H